MSGQEHLAQRLQQAATAYERGELEAASALLEPIMGQLAQHPGALHLLGIACSDAGQVPEPIHSRSIGRWKRYEPFIGILTQRLAHLS